MEDLYEEPITIDDINIVKTSQLARQQEEEQNMTNHVPTHSYNLRKCPTKRREWIALAIAENDDNTTGVEEKQQYVRVHPKVHAHVMLTQMNIKQGLLTFGEKGNEAILKELKQLHEKKAITPVQ